MNDMENNPRLRWLVKYHTGTTYDDRYDETEEHTRSYEPELQYHDGKKGRVVPTVRVPEYPRKKHD
jgi:hypothetical protein